MLPLNRPVPSDTACFTRYAEAILLDSEHPDIELSRYWQLEKKPPYDVVAAFWSSDSETGSPCSGAIVFTSSFNCWMLRYKLTLLAR